MWSYSLGVKRKVNERTQKLDQSIVSQSSWPQISSQRSHRTTADRFHRTHVKCLSVWRTASLMQSFIHFLYFLNSKEAVYIFIYRLPPRGQFTTSLLWLQIMLEQRMQYISVTITILYFCLMFVNYQMFISYNT